MAIVGYARVSTRGQSLDAQIKALKENGVEDVNLFSEKESGANNSRGELSNMLKFVRKGDALIVTKLDRIARSTKHLLEIAENLEKKGVTFKVLNIQLDTSTPTGKLMLTMLGAIAQFEREMMLERQAEGFAIAKAKGLIKGRPSTAKNKTSDVVNLANSGLTKQEIANQLGIGIASVYRILKEQKSAKTNVG
jgi:DNA invertase Pin-like site-specific DNA recombinase